MSERKVKNWFQSLLSNGSNWYRYTVAQVHAAVLRGSRKNVVIKVLKPDVTDTLAADLSFIYIASRILTFLNPELARLSLAEIVGDIRSSMMDEAGLCTAVEFSLPIA